MGNEEKEADLEQLLNSLIEKGWKPFGDNAIKIDYDGMKTRCGYGAITYLYRDSYIDDYGDKVEYEERQHQFNNRELVSKESGLWQFVCKNGMVKNVDDYSWELYDGAHGQCDVYKNGYEGGTRWEQVDYEYRLLESSLKDESELEDFLLSNIKVEGIS